MGERMRAVGVIIAGAFVLSACQQARNPPAPDVAFSAEEAAFIRKAGSGVVSGHAFRTRSTGTVVNAAGEVVRLVPVTAYARQRFAALYGTGKFLPVSRYPANETLDPAYGEMTRTVKTAANGRFVFEGVAPGRYYVTTQVVWSEGSTREGGSVYDSVTLTGRETEPVDLVLSGN